MRDLYFVTGIGTGIGKTVCSALLVEALQADYWKPIQCGDENGGDAGMVRSLVTNAKSRIFDPAFLFKARLSPDAAAQIDGVTIDEQKLKVPAGAAPLIIEGAGGALVPINHSALVIDLIKQFGARAVVVSRGYLGTINHTLLTVEALRSRSIQIAGLLFNGNFPPQSKESILRFANLPLIGEIPELDKINKRSLAAIAHTIRL